MAAEKKRGEKTSFILGYVGEDGLPIVDRDEMVKFPASLPDPRRAGKGIRFAATSFSHDEDSEKQQSDSLRGSDADVFGEDGFLWGSGGFEMEIPLLGALDILRTLLRDANPVSTPVPSKTIVRSTHQLAGVSVEKVSVVSGGSLTGTPTLLQTLADYEYDANDPTKQHEIRLTVTPSSTATLASANTAATITIAYNDAAGAGQTHVLSFPNDKRTVAQTWKLPAGATITAITPAGWGAGGTFDVTIPDSFFTFKQYVVLFPVRGLDAGAVQGATLAETLSNYRDAVQLTVRPSSAAAVSSGDGTIALVYTDAAGVDQTHTWTFTSGNLTTAQTFDLPAGAEVKSVTPSANWNAGTYDIVTNVLYETLHNPEPDRPGRLRVKYAGSLTDHKLRIRGVRRVGLASEDTLPLREDIDLGADVLTTKYFHKINKVEVRDAKGKVVNAPAGTIEITSEPGGYETVIKMSNELIRIMMEAEVGGIPRRITRGEFTSGQLNISDTVRLVIDMLSKRVDKRATIEGGDDEKFVATAAEHPTEFSFVSEKFFPDFGGYLEIDGSPFVFDSATADINRNEDFSTGKRASRFRAELESSDRRNVTAQIQGSYISGTSEEDKFIRWDEKFRNNEAVNAKIANYHWPTTGRQYSMEWIMPYCEVTSPVRVEASGPGKIPVTINLKAVPDPTVAGASELTVRIVSDDRWV